MIIGIYDQNLRIKIFPVSITVLKSMKSCYMFTVLFKLLVCRTGWTQQQNRLYCKVVKILNSDRLARLAFAGVCWWFCSSSFLTCNGTPSMSMIQSKRVRIGINM